jgi:hypothetical protein
MMMMMRGVAACGVGLAEPRARRGGIGGGGGAKCCGARSAQLAAPPPRRRRAAVTAAAGGVDGADEPSPPPRRVPAQFVPADGLRGESPEAKGAAALARLFTYVAIRIVQAQLEGLGNDGGFAPQATGARGDIEAPSYDALRRAMEDVPLGDGDTWLEALMGTDAPLAARIMAVRAAYAGSDFDYERLAALTAARISAGNTRLMRAHVEQTAGGGGGEGGGDGGGAGAAEAGT